VVFLPSFAAGSGISKRGRSKGRPVPIAEAAEIQRTLNADRRQLTEEQRRQVAANLRQEGHSYRAIGAAP